MDTSETYIKMCEKAEEIQNGFDAKSVTTYRLTTGQLINVDGNYLMPIPEFSVKGTSDIWLPRQDQLQEMIGVKTASDFSRLCYRTLDPNDWLFKYEADWSMEQLWLAFVMKEKYNKVWDGENWVNA